MNALSKSEFQAEAEPTLRQIFASDNPFCMEPFAPNTPVRRILFDWDSKYVVPPLLFNKIITTASRLGDSGFYLSSLWRGDASQPYAWYIPFSEVKVYTNSSDSPISSYIFSEQVIFSPQGLWGIMTTHEFHMLLGGTYKFIDELTQMVPDLDKQVNSFLEHWQHYKINDGIQTDSWLPELLRQVYGSEATEKLLQDIGLP